MRTGLTMKLRFYLAMLAAAVALAPAAARADPAASPQDFVTRLMARAPGKGKTFACFTRIYDAAHLAAHPQQNVRSMMVLITVDSTDVYNYSLAVGSLFRSRKGLLESSGDCAFAHDESDASSPRTARCSIACDGGSFEIALKDNGSVLLTVPEGARLWRPGSEDPGDNVHGAFGPDDKLFRLDRAPLSQCVALGADAAEKAQLRRGE